jgi:HAD superfamily hydrolase (TIGR01549 family)
LGLRFAHVIWDYDGTLFDTYPVMGAALCDALKSQGIDEPLEQTVSLLKVSMGHAAQYYNERYLLGEDFWARFRELRKTAELEHTKPFDGIVELCHEIKRAGGNNYLLTHRGESAKHFLEKYGILSDFDDFVTADQKFPRKPSPDAILYLMEKHGFAPDNALMVGDRDIDILAGKNAGIHTCYFTDGGEPYDVAEFNIQSFSELAIILGVSF